MQRKIIVSVVLVTVLIVVGVLVAWGLVATKPDPPRRNDQRPPLVVAAVTLQPQTIIEPIVGYGTAQADRYARLSAQVTGEVVELGDWLKPGIDVKQGQLLLRIDEEEYVRILERARANLAAEQAQLVQLEVEENNDDRLIQIAAKELSIAQADFDRVKGLFEEGESHPREFDQYHRALQQALSAHQVLANRKALIPTRRDQREAACKNRQAEVELAQLSVDRCRVVAPFDGRIDELSIELGERVQLGRELVTLLDPNLIDIPIELPASVHHRVRVDARCRLVADSSDEVTWSGRVERISPTADEDTRTFRLYVEVNNAEQTSPLVPGFFVRAIIDGPTLTDVLLVPRGAVQQERVFVFSAGEASVKPVHTVRHLREQSIITGLEPGTVVITSNLDALFEGAVVRLDQDSTVATQPVAPDDTGLATQAKKP